MTSARAHAPSSAEEPLTDDVCARALDARDARFDGLFYVGITTTRIYCRPVCPARVSYHSHRRFFASAAAAERAGFRPCLRCRPELAPGRALVDAVPRLADAAAHRIAAGALNGRSVAELAGELGVSERHLRRALERELGISPVELAQTHRLLLAKRLLADTRLPVTRIAFASGFQSLRRFNAVFRERYRMSPSALRRAPRPNAGRFGAGAHRTPAPAKTDLVRLTLAYRAPLAWDVLVTLLGRDAIAGVEVVDGRCYRRTVRLDGCSGVVSAEDAPADARVNVDVSPSLVPALMPLLARLRRLFDLDAEPEVIDAHLTRAGLGTLVVRRPGLRIPGAICGFEVAWRALLRGRAWSGAASRELARRVASALGEPIDTGIESLDRLSPSAERVAEAGAAGLAVLGVPRPRAESIAAVARMVVGGDLRLEPGGDATATRRALLEDAGVGDAVATAIVMRALYWPDAFAVSEAELRRAAGIDDPHALEVRAEQWRPWRAYAALHLCLDDRSARALPASAERREPRGGKGRAARVVAR